MTPMSGRRQQQRAGSAAIEEAVATALAQLADDTKARYEAAKAREAEDATQHVTPTDLDGARAVRTRTGWHRILKVNRTTVTVPGPWGDTMRIPYAQIREARK